MAIHTGRRMQSVWAGHLKGLRVRGQSPNVSQSSLSSFCSVQFCRQPFDGNASLAPQERSSGLRASVYRTHQAQNGVPSDPDFSALRSHIDSSNKIEEVLLVSSLPTPSIE